MYQRTNIRRGMAVVSYDGVQVGRVIDVRDDGILIEKGQFFLHDFRVPLSDISGVRGEELVLVRDHAALRLANTEANERHTTDTVGIAGVKAPPAHGLGLSPTDLTRARMDSAKFQDLRAAGPGWEPLSVDEDAEEKKAPRTGGPDTEPPTRY